MDSTNVTFFFFNLKMAFWRHMGIWTVNSGGRGGRGTLTRAVTQPAEERGRSLRRVPHSASLTLARAAKKLCEKFTLSLGERP